MQFSLLSYNIRKGKGYRKSTPSIKDIADYLQQTHCDILFCQEITESTTDHGSESQCCNIAHILQMNHHYGPNAYHRQGNHGNAIFSKFETEYHCNLNISTSALEYRGILYAVVKMPNTKRLHLFNVHLGLTPGQRQKQMNLLLTYINKVVPHDEPLIIAGDFNDFDGKVEKLITENKNLKNAMHALPEKNRKTWPSYKPKFQLDHVFYHNLTLKEVKVFENDAPGESLSDHLPIYSVFLL
ncbi:MAG: hypothetical protein A3F10_03430 [Coxiella sp. RIFCSPHIGHO2_12_FULL_42_15]|nr:MAG: hypothetical protein A3F10_03430 [Coxiella sp. RIFCSPHIGHO2_12_FULL_42_15]